VIKGKWLTKTNCRFYLEIAEKLTVHLRIISITPLKPIYTDKTSYIA